MTGEKFYGKLGGTADRSIRPEIREFYAAKYPKVLFCFYFEKKRKFNRLCVLIIAVIFITLRKMQYIPIKFSNNIKSRFGYQYKITKGRCFYEKNYRKRNFFFSRRIFGKDPDRSRLGKNDPCKQRFRIYRTQRRKHIFALANSNRSG